MLGVEAVPALLYIILMTFVPDSPRWLVMVKKDDSAALGILNKMYKDDRFAGEELKNIKSSLLQGERGTAEEVKFFNKKFTKPISLAFLLAFFNQLSGINFVLYYAPVILEKAGFASTDSLLSSVSIGGANLVFTFLGLYLIDRSGRKSLMYLGSFGYIISLSMIAYGFYAELSSSFNLFFILLFIASHAVGQGAVIWVYISEIFPNQIRASGQAFGSGTHWVFAAIVTMFGEVVISSFAPWVIFIVFAGFMILQLLFTHFIMVETKGKSLEDLQSEFVK
jgi:sugar porter (SP) family MFS transporter